MYWKTPATPQNDHTDADIIYISLSLAYTPPTLLRPQKRSQEEGSLVPPQHPCLQNNTSQISTYTFGAGPSRYSVIVRKSQPSVNAKYTSPPPRNTLEVISRISHLREAIFRLDEPANHLEPAILWWTHVIRLTANRSATSVTAKNSTRCKTLSSSSYMLHTCDARACPG